MLLVMMVGRKKVLFNSYNFDSAQKDWNKSSLVIDKCKKVEISFVQSIDIYTIDVSKLYAMPCS